jgi:hypothetical protein
MPTPDILVLPKLVIDGKDERVETGVVQFFGDWPGVFIRGDNAFAYSNALRQLLATSTAKDPQAVQAIVARSWVEGLARLLESSNMANWGESDVDLWLDDVRPAPAGWIHVKTVEQAKALLTAGRVRKASLDHDLGACDVCMAMYCRDETPSVEKWLARSQSQSMPHCEHVGTGYQLICWMEETGYWPKELLRVHSSNPAGRAKMEMAITRQREKFGRWA